MRRNLKRLTVFALLTLAALGALGPPTARAGFSLGEAANYAVLFEGAGKNTLQVTNVTANGNIGVGNTGLMTLSGPSTVNGSIAFSAANTGQLANNNSNNVVTGGVSYGSTDVTTALNTANALNATLGAESGTSININGNTTINASSGVLDASGNRVFTVTGFNTTNNNVLTINGDAAGDSVVLNFTGNVNFNNQVVLNGISADQVLYNLVGGSGLTGGPTLQINNNASSNLGMVQGIFLDPNGAISVTNANVLGRVIGGDTHDFQDVSGTTITAPAGVPEPSTMTLLLSGLAGFGWEGLRRFRRRSRAAATR
jgi:hypothetical protein